MNGNLEDYGAKVLNNVFSTGSLDLLSVTRSTFNYPVIIGNNVRSCYNLFYMCNNFNQPVTIPNSVKICSGMFFRCENFNKPVTMSNNATDLSNMFRQCNNFNQPITIPESAIYCDSMFSFCPNFYQNITIPNNVSAASSFIVNPKDITVYGNNIHCRSLISDARWINSINIFFKKSPGFIYGMIPRSHQWSSYNRLNIFCNSSFVSKFLGDGSSIVSDPRFSWVNVNNSIVDDQITWSSMTNGYYNSSYNVYIYYNYS